MGAAPQRSPMMIQSHVLAAVLLGLIISRWRAFAPRDWALALGFSVAIDLDHALQFPTYLATHGTAGLTPTTMLHWGHAWQGLMHTPWALVLVIPFALYYRSTLPFVFWGLHMVQDYVIATRFVVWGSTLEWVIDAALLLPVVTMFAWTITRPRARLAPQ